MFLEQHLRKQSRIGYISLPSYVLESVATADCGHEANTEELDEELRKEQAEERPSEDVCRFT